MFTTTVLPWIQIILAILLVAGILLQRSGDGLGGAFGGGDSGGGLHHTRRGFEKILYQATLVLAVLFAASALIAIIL